MGDKKAERTVTIIGAGRSGRGMLGELYDRDGFHIIFADVRDDLVEGLKKQGYYTVQMTDIKTNEQEERCIEGFEVVHANREKERYLNCIIHSDLVSTALLPKDFDVVIADLAEAVRLRRKERMESLMFITLGANYVGLYEYFDRKLCGLLEGEDLSYYHRYVRLVLSIVNRKNLLPEKGQEGEDRFRILGDNKSVLRVEASEELRKLPSLPGFFRLEKNLGAAMAVKIWSGNLVQCSMAFVALKNGLKDTYEAAYHEEAARYAYFASVEGYQAVAEEYGLKARDDKQMVTVFRNPAFSDSLYRIAREPLRKFRRNDRFIGPALCCMKHGILPYYITKCLAYGFYYDRPEEPQAVLLQEYIRENGIEKAVETYCQLNLEARDEKIVFDLIVAAYRDIGGKDPFTE